VLLARRLVEAGVRLVQVNWYRGPDEPPANPCWDSHTAESARLKDVLVPPTDRAYSALIEDLHQRGLLDETLVICMAEFGRSPRLDAAGGRGHWGSVFSVAARLRLVFEAECAAALAGEKHVERPARVVIEHRGGRLAIDRALKAVEEGPAIAQPGDVEVVGQVDFLDLVPAGGRACR
jgi:hypothetical protein